jgi:hypothetical protein
VTGGNPLALLELPGSLAPDQLAGRTPLEDLLPLTTRLNGPSAVGSGLVITRVAKAWFIDRMVLYEDMKARDPKYAGWER